MTHRPSTFLSLVVISLLSLFSCNNNKTIDSTIHSISTDAPANFFGKPDEYLNWQAEQILNMTELVLSQNPPRLQEPVERQMAMLMLDAVFHDVNAPHHSAVQEFHHRRTLSVLEELANNKTSEGIQIWKLYNMGIITRTKSITVAFDLIRGYSARSDSFALSDDIIRKIAHQCDVLFISHFHRDHADEAVATIFLEQGKPVVAPPDLWKDKTIYSKITHLEAKAHELQSLPLQHKDLDLELVVYPGHQGADIPNNVVLVITPEQYSVCHTGDQSSTNDFSWIDDVKNHFKEDILVPNCWTTNPLRTAEGYNPGLIIPTHENELGHTIDHREAYALNYSRWEVPHNKIIMAWGESYNYQP